MNWPFDILIFADLRRIVSAQMVFIGAVYGTILYVRTGRMRQA